jgi:hypothetical protein
MVQTHDRAVNARRPSKHRTIMNARRKNGTRRPFIARSCRTSCDIRTPCVHIFYSEEATAGIRKSPRDPNAIPTNKIDCACLAQGERCFNERCSYGNYIPLGQSPKKNSPKKKAAGAVTSRQL